MGNKKVFWLCLITMTLIASSALAQSAGGSPSQMFGAAADEMDAWRLDTAWAKIAGLVWCGVVAWTVWFKMWKSLVTVVLIPVGVMFWYQGPTYFARMANSTGVPMSQAVGAGP